jgi:seryl-tRNA synthetase
VSSQSFRQDLFESGVLTYSGIPGVYHRSFAFEKVKRSVREYLSVAGRDRDRQQLHFSPLMARETLERTGFLESFPNLTGVVASFTAGESELPRLLSRLEGREEWAEFMTPTDLALCGAACQPLYPLLVGTLIPSDGLYYEIEAPCFRHEWSDDPARMQSFSQHEFVCVGDEVGALEHREDWLRRGVTLLGALGLSVDVVVANDPFFGRGGKLMSAVQREEKQKLEIVTSITSEAKGAIVSANFHDDHFGRAFDLNLVDGGIARTACVGFGLERITLALLFRHGLDYLEWPGEVRQHLRLEGESPSEAVA